MIKSIGSWAHNWLPPVIANHINRHISGRVRFEGDFASWKEAVSASQGYDSEAILAKVLAATLKVKNGEAAYERDSVTFEKIDYSWPLLSALMWGAARSGGELNVLDFGGALGSSYFQNRQYLKALPNVSWSVVEQAHFVQAGRQYIQGQKLRFYQSIDDCLAENRPNVILLSSALQYIDTPFDLLSELSSTGAACLVVDRTPFSNSDEDRLLIQKVPPNIYSASYPMWAFSQSKFLSFTELGWNKVSQHSCPEGLVNSRDGFDFSFQGMLFEAKT